MNAGQYNRLWKRDYNQLKCGFTEEKLRIFLRDHMSNEEVLAKAGTRRKLVETIRKRQLQFLGYVLRIEELIDLGITWKIEGKRAR